MSVNSANLRGSDEATPFMPHVREQKCLINTKSLTNKNDDNTFSATCDEFISHHGKKARHYLTMATKGLSLQKSLGHKLFAKNEVNFRLLELGSLYSASEKDLPLLKKEYEYLLRLMPDPKNQIEW